MNCENCGAEIKSGFIKSNNVFSNESIELINHELSLTSTTYCNACGDELLKKANKIFQQKSNDNINKIAGLKSKLNHREYTLKQRLSKIIKFLPVLTTHTPYKWEYTSLELVSGQTVSGTGIFSEVFSDFTDFFGANSNSFSGKLAKSEEFVLNQLRAKAVKIGANAVIATDIDYGEVGALKGMLMVCAAGTAIKLKNTEILEDKQDIVNEITSLGLELESITQILQLKNTDFIEKYNQHITVYKE